MSHDKGLDKTDEEVHWQAWKGRLPAANDGKIRELNFCPKFVAIPRLRFLYEDLSVEKEWIFPPL